MKIIAHLILFTLLIACKKDKTHPEPERMWYWDDCRIQSFALHGLNYVVDYNKEGYPGRVAIQHQYLNTTYIFRYQKDQLIETIRLDDNRVNQKVKFTYDLNRLVSVHWFGGVKDPKTSKTDTVEMRRFEFAYSSLDKPTSSTVFSYDERHSRKLLPITTFNYVYNDRGNVSQFGYEIYVGGGATGSKGTSDVYYDDKPATGEFLNLLRFSYYYQDDDSVIALFSANNWIRSYAAHAGSGPYERKIDLEYDEHGNAKSRFYGFSNIKWNCN
ncbi:hypothetical protein [Dyadobacter sp. OTU695]|uniref:hypothetical protein n=1 Tax=Dyadobacter sp. OTU695 TaxID=3043860 RepID=UPI00313DDF55